MSNEDVSTIVGLRIVRANSSLRNFAVELADGRGLLIEAVDLDGSPALVAKILDAGELPQAADAVCTVDWGWIYDSEIATVKPSEKLFRFDLKPAGPLNISVAVWQGSPFLSFHPFRPQK